MSKHKELKEEVRWPYRLSFVTEERVRQQAFTVLDSFVVAYLPFGMMAG